MHVVVVCMYVLRADAMDLIISEAQLNSCNTN